MGLLYWWELYLELITSLVPQSEEIYPRSKAHTEDRRAEREKEIRRFLKVSPEHLDPALPDAITPDSLITGTNP